MCVPIKIIYTVFVDFKDVIITRMYMFVIDLNWEFYSTFLYIYFTSNIKCLYYMLYLQFVTVLYNCSGVTTGFVTVGIFASLPIIALRSLDSILQLDPFLQLSERMKRNIAWLLLELSGIDIAYICIWMFRFIFIFKRTNE